MNILDSNSMLLQKRSLDFLWQRQQAIADNIANVDTPGYKAKIVSFEARLQKSLQAFATQNNNFGGQLTESLLGLEAGVETSEQESMRLDGNNVNIDTENVELVRTQLQYEYAMRQINDEFSRLRMAIEGR